MRCPTCGGDTPAALPRCVRCDLPLADPPATSADPHGRPDPAVPFEPAGAEPTMQDHGGSPPATPGREPDGRMPWPDASAFPFVPLDQRGTGPRLIPAPQRRHGRATGGVIPWVVAGVLGLALAATMIVLWPAEDSPAAPPGPGETTVVQPPQNATTSAAPSSQAAPQNLRKYWAGFFTETVGYPDPSEAGRPAGSLNEGRHYVFCKKWGSRVGNDEIFNHWWLLTDLDEVFPGGQARAWVPARYLRKWDNDEAKDDDGTTIPTCDS